MLIYLKRKKNKSLIIILRFNYNFFNDRLLFLY